MKLGLPAFSILLPHIDSSKNTGYRANLSEIENKLQAASLPSHRVKPYPPLTDTALRHTLDVASSR